MQTPEELDQWYANPDPWGYETHPDDAERKYRILAALDGKQFKRALDIGCGEGWITKDLPAKVIHGLEISEVASARMPEPVVAVTEPVGKYDLVVLTGVLYAQYDYRAMGDLVRKHASKKATILLCHIEDWLQPLFGEHEAELVHSEKFPYRQYTELLEVYKCP